MMTSIDRGTAARRRSVLFMPASNPRAIAKIPDLACDEVILDLEDAVAPEAKVTARGAAIAAVGALPGRAVAIRVNGLDTPWGRDDLTALADVDGLAAVVVPKVGNADDLAVVRKTLGAEGPPIWAMIETCGAVLGLAGIVAGAATTGTTLLIAGTNDLAKDMRCRPGADRMPLIPTLVQIVIAARAAGLMVLDGVCNALGDVERLASECAQGAMLGFDGKTLIHPNQIATANDAFGPSDEAIARARAIVAAFAHPDAAALGAIRLNGEMIERLHLAEAEQVLASAG